MRVHSVNMIDVYTLCDNEPMETMGERLKKSRKLAGHKSARQTALKFGWKVSTYAAHENGQNDFDEVDAKKYGRAFGVSAGWLLTAEGSPTPHTRPNFAIELKAPLYVPIVGYVGANSEAHTYAVPAGHLDEVEAPEGSTDQTVAVEIRGNSLGALFDRWIVFYDDVRSPVTPDLYGKLCVVGLADERILIKKIRRRRDGKFDLIANTDEGGIENAVIKWAAQVKHMVPR